MASSASRFLPRAVNAFSSFAVTVALAVLTILALAVGSIRDSKAESNAGLLLERTTVEDPAVEWNQPGRPLPGRTPSEAQPQVMSRQPLRSASSALSRRTVEVSPTQEWMGVSKLAFPLLVGDLTTGRSLVTPAVMTGKPVGAK